MSHTNKYGAVLDVKYVFIRHGEPPENRDERMHRDLYARLALTLHGNIIPPLIKFLFAKIKRLNVATHKATIFIIVYSCKHYRYVNVFDCTSLWTVFYIVLFLYNIHL